MTANLSTAATKTLRTIAATDAGHIDTYSGTAGIDCRSLAALVRKGFLVRVAGGYARHAITTEGRAAIGETAPVVAPVARPATVILIGSKAQYAADYTQAGADSVDAAMKAARARAAAMRSTRRGR